MSEITALYTVRNCCSKVGMSLAYRSIFNLRRSSQAGGSSDTSWDSDFGGSRTSVMPCFAEAKKKGGCTRKDCEWSHRPRIIKKFLKDKAADDEE